MSDMAEESVSQEKAYCCGNSTQREAKLIAKFDLIVSLVFFSTLLAFLIVLVTDPEYLLETSKNTPDNSTTDLAAFLEWPSGLQESFISIQLVLHVIFTLLSVTLLIAAMQKNPKLLMIWFIMTIVFYSTCILMTGVAGFFLHDKIFILVCLVSAFLYKWYGLWIVKLLRKEITSVSESETYDNGLANGGETDTVDSDRQLDKF